MALERLSVEIQDNAAQVTSNIDQLATSIDRLTKQIEQNTAATQERAAAQQRTVRSSRGLIASIIGFTTRVVRATAIVLGLATTIGFALTVMRRMNIGFGALGAAVARDIPLVSALAGVLISFVRTIGRFRIAIAGALTGLSNFIATTFAGVPGVTNLTTSMMRLRGILRGYGQAVARAGTATTKMTGSAEEAAEATQALGASSGEASDELRQFGNVEEETTARTGKLSGALSLLEAKMGIIQVVVGLAIRVVGGFVRSIGISLVRAAAQAAIHTAELQTKVEFLTAAIEGFNQTTRGSAASLQEFQRFIIDTSIALGLNQEQLTEITALAIDFGRSMNFTTDQVQQLINRVIDVNAALGEDLFQTFESVISGTVSFSRRLLALGIDLRDQKLATLGLVDAQKAERGELDAQARAQAKLQAFLQQSENFMGLAEKRARTFAGELQRLEQAAAQVNRAFGEGAQRVLLPFVTLVSEATTAIAGLPPALQAAVGSFQAFAGVGLTIVGTIVKLAGTVAIVQGIFAILNKVVAGASAAFLESIAAISGTSTALVTAAASGTSASAAFAVLGGIIRKTVVTSFKFLGSVVDVTKAKLISFSRVGVGTLITSLTKATVRITLFAAKFGAVLLVLDGVIRAIGRASEGFARISARVNKTTDDVTKSLTAWERFTKIIGDAAFLIGEFFARVVLLAALAVQGLITAVSGLTDLLGITDGAFESNVETLEAYIQEIGDLTSIVEHFADVQRDAADATNTLTTAVERLTVAEARSLAVQQSIARGFTDVGLIKREITQIDEELADVEKEVADAVFEATRNLQGEQEFLREQEQILRELVVLRQEQASSTSAVAEALDSEIASTEITISLTERRIDALQDEIDTAETFNETAIDLMTKRIELSQRLTRTELEFRDALETVRVAQEQASGVFDTAAEKQRTFEFALRRVFDELGMVASGSFEAGNATQQLVEIMQRQGRTTDAAREALQALSVAEADLIEQSRRLTEVEQFFVDIGQAISNSFQQALGDTIFQLTQGAANIRDIMESLLDDILRQLSRFAARALTQQILGGLLSAIGGGAGLGGAAGGIGQLITGGTGVFQKGGIVTKPTLGLVGEAGPEAIIPLQDLDKVTPQPATEIVILNLTGRPEDVVAKGVAAEPNLVLNPVLQDARLGGKTRTFFRGR